MKWLQNKYFSIVILLFCSLSISAQEQRTKSLEYWEDSLLVMLDIARNTESVPKMEALNKEFSQTLEKVITMDDAFDYAFPKLSQKMSTITSPDGAFRLFNWNIEDNYKEHNFYCLVLKNDEKTGKKQIIELKDNYRYIFSPDTKSLDHRNWYGALYYDIIPVQKFGKTVYTLLGWNGNNRSSSKKIVEAMTFSKDKIDFNSPIFKYGKETKKRLVFEHSSEAVMSLKYHKKKKEQKIVFDHLEPQSEQVKGIRDFYFPDMTFDAFYLEGNKWVLHENVEMTVKTPKGFNEPR